jgi:6-phosphofructokinase 1
MPMVGIPKTIDNDLMVTDFTFGFDTAINIVTEAVDRLRTTTESHRRIMVVETMGRHAGWIACFAGIAVAADYILVPRSRSTSPSGRVLKRRRSEGKNYGIVIVSKGRIPRQGFVSLEAERDAFGQSGSAGSATRREDRRGRDRLRTRCVVLGHIQRGGPPERRGSGAGHPARPGAGSSSSRKRFGTMVALSGTRIVETTLGEGGGREQDARPHLLQ